MPRLKVPITLVYMMGKLDSIQTSTVHFLISVQWSVKLANYNLLANNLGNKGHYIQKFPVEYFLRSFFVVFSTVQSRPSLTFKPNSYW